MIIRNYEDIHNYSIPSVSDYNIIDCVSLLHCVKIVLMLQGIPTNSKLRDVITDSIYFSVNYVLIELIGCSTVCSEERTNVGY